MYEERPGFKVPLYQIYKDVHHVSSHFITFLGFFIDASCNAGLQDGQKVGSVSGADAERLTSKIEQSARPVLALRRRFASARHTGMKATEPSNS